MDTEFEAIVVQELMSWASTPGDAETVPDSRAWLFEGGPASTPGQLGSYLMAIVRARRGLSRESKKFGARYVVLAIHNDAVQPIQSESMTCGLSESGCIGSRQF